MQLYTIKLTMTCRTTGKEHL